MNRLSEIENKNRPSIISFGGIKGGVGRSTLCAEIARSLARQGKRILCVDANWECPTFHNLVHGEEQGTGGPDWYPFSSEQSHVADYISTTPVKNIFLMGLATLIKQPFRRPKFDVWRLFDQWVELDFDYIFIDLPPTLDETAISLFVLSDIPILVISPEPAAIRAAIQTGRAALLQSLGLHPKAEEYIPEMMELLALQTLTLNREFLIRNAANSGVRQIVNETCDALELYMITNFVREGSERDLGYVVSHAMFQELGVYPRTLGAVDHEDRRWFFNRRTASHPTRGEEALSDDIERIAKSLKEIVEFDQTFPRPVPRSSDAHPGLKIGLRDDLPRNDLRQHCRRLWEGYRREVSIGLMFADPQRRSETADMLESAYRGILTLGGNSPKPTQRPVEQKKSPKREPETNDQNRITAGKEIERLRKSFKLSLRDLSHRTQIGVKYLAAIEEGKPEFLPRPVYLRGYLREIAGVLGVEPDDLIEEYFSFLDYS